MVSFSIISMVNRGPHVGGLWPTVSSKSELCDLELEDRPVSRWQKGWSTRGRILKRKPSCYSLSPLQLCLEISIYSHSRNLLQFLQVNLLYTVKENGGKPDRKPLPLHKIHTKTSNLKTLKIMPRNLNQLYVHEFGFCWCVERTE